MGRGERLDFLLSLRKALLTHPESWRVLQTFELSAVDQGEDEAWDEWVFRALAAGTPDQLRELAAYLAVAYPGEVPEAEPNPDDMPWKEADFFRLFLSHSTKDRHLVSEVKSQLADYGIEGFVSHQDIEPSKEWLTVIKNGLRTCDGFAAFVCGDFRSSAWCDQEADFAVSRGVPIVPISLDGDPHGFLGVHQAVKTSSRNAVALALQIFDALRQSPGARDTLSQGIVCSFARSNSYKAAHTRSSRLKYVSAWTSELKDVVDRATRTNGQIKGASNGSVAANARSLAGLAPIKPEPPTIWNTLQQ